jgi:hypothetical protein
MLRHVALVRAPITRVTRIGELGTTLATDAQCEEIPSRSVCRLLVTASVIPTSPIFVTLMKGALSSSETSVPTRATRPTGCAL